ncbi:MAG: hypothetical protein NZ898_13825 [Myxococcota bacterium]|nr:hypothetical protein [Myxococcota bacterium]MDW8362914.1 hypothetical protein [Myxococcales bacterium]
MRSRRLHGCIWAVLLLALLDATAEAQRGRGRNRGRDRRPPATATEEPLPDNPFEPAAGGQPAPPASSTPPFGSGGTTAPPSASPAPAASPAPQQGGGTSPTNAGAGSGASRSASPAAGPSQAPPADEAATALEEAPVGPDLGPLRAEQQAIVDELVQLRTRVALLGEQLFSSRVRIIVQDRGGEQRLERLVVTLDGAPVFRASGGEIAAADGRRVFEGFAAPGPHVLGIELERRARANDVYRYSQRDSWRFEVLRGRLTEVTVLLEDDSGIAEDFPDDEEGEYDVRVRLRVATRELRR